MIASVAIDELGRTSRVDGLFEKLDGIATLAPRISRVLVAASQHDEVRSSGGRLQLVPVRTAAQALEIVFGDALGIAARRGRLRRRAPPRAGRRLLPAGAGRPRRRRRLVAGRARGRASPCATGRPPSTIAIACSSPPASPRGTSATPARSPCPARPGWTRNRRRSASACLTHLVQQCADTGTPRRRPRSRPTPRRRCRRIWARRSCRSCSSPARWRGCGP